jgi:hypothetical protein
MKKIVTLLLCLPFFLNSCSKNALTDFDMAYQVSLTIPSSTGIDIPLSVITPDIATNSTTEFKNRGTDASHVKEVRLTNAMLTITNPPGKTFSFLKSIHVLISTAGSPDVEIAFLDNVPNLNRITLTTTGAILDPYIKSDKFKITVKAVTKETILQDITLQADLAFHVKADLL